MGSAVSAAGSAATIAFLPTHEPWGASSGVFDLHNLYFLHSVARFHAQILRALGRHGEKKVQWA